MRAEATPTGNVVTDFRTIWEAKLAPRQNWLRRLETYVLESYTQFILHSAHLENLPRRNWSQVAKGVLRHCYDVEGKNLSRVKASFLSGLSDAAKARCPYCMLRQPASIDHFLPIDFFPEFSVLVLNWVYVCEGCNRTKGTRLTDDPRSLLNPYFDNIPNDAPLLYANVTIFAGSPKVSFVVPNPNLILPNPALSPIAERQFAALNLGGRLELEAGAVLNSTIGTIVHEANGPLNAEMLMLRLEARRANLEDLGVNAWERRLFEAMELCPDLLDHVNERIANRPPKAPLAPPHDLNIVLLAQTIAATER